MADGLSDDGTGSIENKNFTPSDDGDVDCDIRTRSDKVINPNKMNLSFYVEQNSSDVSEKYRSNGVATKLTSIVSTSRQTNFASEMNKEENDSRKKRCVDRYDSSESSDSGVAVLSSAECSGSDIAEPGSPYSPASSVEEAPPAAARRAPCKRAAPPPRRAAAKRARPADSAVLKPTSLQAAAAAARRNDLAFDSFLDVRQRGDRKNQGRITEYFKSQMKPFNGLKRDICSWIGKTDSKKKSNQKTDVTDDLEKYIAYLSQTFSPRVLLNPGKGKNESSIEFDLKTKGKDAKNSESRVPDNGGQMRAEIHKSSTEVDKGCATLDNNIVGKPKPSIKNINISPKVRADLKNQATRNINKREAEGVYLNGPLKKNCKQNNTASGVGLNNIVRNHNVLDRPSLIPGAAHLHNSFHNAGSNNFPTTTVLPSPEKLNSADTLPIITSTHNGIRQIPMSVGGQMLNNIQLATTANGKPCGPMPMASNINQHCTSISTGNAQIPFMSLPPTVMLTTLRIPQAAQASHPMNSANHVPNTFNPTQNVAAASPNKLNGQFVFPLMQNLNGTVVQLPNLVTKVGQNIVIPNVPASMNNARPDPMTSQQQPQMVINGTFVKLTGGVQTSFSGILPKPMNNTNITFSVPHKNINTSVGTVMMPKGGFPLNVTHPLLVPSSGFIINPIQNSITTQAQVGFGQSSTPGNVILTNSVTSVVQNTGPIHFNHIQHCNQVVTSKSIPIAPVKPPDKVPPRISYSSLPFPSAVLPEATTITKNSHPHLKQALKAPIIHTKPSTMQTPCPFADLQKALDSIVTPYKKEEVTIVPVEEMPPPKPLCSSVEIISRYDNNANISKVCSASASDIKMERSSSIKEMETSISPCKDGHVNSKHATSTIVECSSIVTRQNEKSIHYPSESRTSKEDDNDSSVSLSVSVNSSDTSFCQKSPILSQPKTIRFPVKARTPSSASEKQVTRTDTSNGSSCVVVCRWEKCDKDFECDTDLLEHLQMVHVNGQAGQESYTCQWLGCKVRGRPSCSRLWLERHTLSHGGNKPFRCVMLSCDRRFSTQMLLERHVNSHFTEQSTVSTSKKSTESTGPKLIRRNGKKLRYRRQPWSARMFDFFDCGIMEGLQWRLVRSTLWRLAGRHPADEDRAHCVSLRAQLVGRRYNVDSRRMEALVRWRPGNVIDDEWIAEKDFQRLKTIPMEKLSTSAKVSMYEDFCASYTSNSAAKANVCISEVKMEVQHQTRNNVVLKHLVKTEHNLSLNNINCDNLKSLHVTGSTILTNLIAKQKNAKSASVNGKISTKSEYFNNTANSILHLSEVADEHGATRRVSGAAKRKQGRRQGGNAFWPSGR